MDPKAVETVLKNNIYIKNNKTHIVFDIQWRHLRLVPGILLITILGTLFFDDHTVGQIQIVRSKLLQCTITYLISCPKKKD